MSTPHFQSEPRRALIIGARSWIGFHLTECFQEAGWDVVATSSQANCKQPSGRPFSQLAKGQALKPLFESVKPDLVINLSIGISEEDFSLHCALASLCAESGVFYVYASSALALDGYDKEPLVESLPAKSISAYGKFKGRCEESLLNFSGLDCLILRFSSIHGWGPYKDSRTVHLLEKVAAGEQVEVSRGVWQNRLTDKALCAAIVKLVESSKTGVVHLGAQDSSEEIDFLKRLAEAFGCSSENIVAGEPRDVNLFVIPDTASEILSGASEMDTINQLLSRAELARYKNKTVSRNT